MPLSQPPDEALVSQCLARQQCARQWRGFLQALAREFVSALPVADLHALMGRVGVRFAEAQPLPPCTALADLQQAMDAVWQAHDWGGVVLTQQPTHLSIRHHCAPLQAAFGPGDTEWAAGFLQGVYQRWFEQAGAAQLSVTPAGPVDAWGCVEFHLGR